MYFNFKNIRKSEYEGYYEKYNGRKRINEKKSNYLKVKVMCDTF